jgi:hypothetical protein
MASGRVLELQNLLVDMVDDNKTGEVSLSQHQGCCKQEGCAIDVGYGGKKPREHSWELV